MHLFGLQSWVFMVTIKTPTNPLPFHRKPTNPRGAIDVFLIRFVFSTTDLLMKLKGEDFAALFLLQMVS